MIIAPTSVRMAIFWTLADVESAACVVRGSQPLCNRRHVRRPHVLTARMDSMNLSKYCLLCSRLNSDKYRTNSNFTIDRLYCERWPQIMQTCCNLISSQISLKFTSNIVTFFKQIGRKINNTIVTEEF